MAYVHFLVPAEGGDAEKRLQDFLRTHAVLKIEQRFAEQPDGLYWCYAIHYDEAPAARESTVPKRELAKDRIDYQKVLSEQDFAVYVRLRDWRMALATEQSVPPFSIFHNATLAEIAKARGQSARA
jgi:superfamily II DNA helicase RecQ